jgi:lipopolysaccharide/colanic/teichoic acid biosynthesis glycosyltransferase
MLPTEVGRKWDGKWDGMFDVRSFSDAAGSSIPALEEWYAEGALKPTLYQRFVKRAADLVVGVVALIVMLPVLLVIAVLVRVKLGPGVIYRQARVGRDGRTFIMLKFRTMEHRDESVSDDIGQVSLYKTRDHRRLTKFGQWLRKLSLDELPQLWNIVRGQMSLVGPRPAANEEVDYYGLRAHPRHSVRPGLTGEWQVTHRLSGIHLIHCFDDDMHYVARVNLWQDVRIILRTFGVVLGGKGI